ncbi:MAG: NFACT RNA binding domain-containing protein [Christensenellales bacterium]|nr:NFACT RNA binding domain-containing protein [Christensenellales bacterium]
MPLDGFTLSLVASELTAALTNGRIDRITQPERDELILTIRNQGRNHLLLLSASAGCARAHLTSRKKTGPLEPPSLCMLLRKHVTGGRIAAIRQIDCDRILEIEIEHYDELGDPTVKRLVCEFMGKHSNLIFVGADGRIIDSARRVSEAMSSVREVLPGLRYERPPAHGKLPFDALAPDRLAEAIGGQGGPLWKILARSVSGLSSQLARELAHRITGDEEARAETLDLSAVAEKLPPVLNELRNQFSPSVLRNPDGEAADFSAFPYHSRVTLSPESYDTLSEAMDAYYQLRDNAERIHQKSASLHRLLKTNIERCQRKLALQQEALMDSERMEEYRLKGELLNGSLHLVQKGVSSVELPNYYAEGIPLTTVELDQKLSPGQNAQRYFKLYQKARKARTLAAEQIGITRAELQHLEGLQDNLSRCTEESDLADLRQELEKLGYVKPNRNRRQLKQLPQSTPMKFFSSSGHAILVGKNNLQNDKLTATAEPDEVWLHVKDMPGSHVIIVGENPDETTIVEAARIAAFYSRGAASSNVPVDYTLRKYVRKPSGAKPGFVIYTHQKTLYVHPECPEKQ